MTARETDQNSNTEDESENHEWTLLDLAGDTIYSLVAEPSSSARCITSTNRRPPGC